MATEYADGTGNDVTKQFAQCFNFNGDYVHRKVVQLLGMLQLFVCK